MNTAKFSVTFLAGVLGAAALASSGSAFAQIGAGPMAPPPASAQPAAAPPPRPKPKPAPPVPPRTSIAGSWKLNPKDSDDAMQRVHAVEAADTISHNPAPPMGYPGGYPYPYPGGYPPMGYPDPNYPYPDEVPQGGGKDIAGNPKMQPLIHPSELITLDLPNPTQEVDVTDDRFRKLILYTDGRELPKKQNDPANVMVTAHWSGSQVITDEKSPLGGKLTRTFELSKDGRKLYESLHIDNGRKSSISIRYVYDATATDVESGDPQEQSDPDRPVLKRNPASDTENPPQQ